MASVHLGSRESSSGFSKLVAIKLVHDHLRSEKEFLKRFTQEARLSAQIDHPNVCQVIDFGVEDGRHFLVMEFLHGVPLGQLLKRVFERGGWRDEELPLLLHLVIQALDGLHAAHELCTPEGHQLDVVHRDLSMGNLFVTSAGRAKVLDFGLAKARNALHKSVTGELRGTIAYMAPEQAAGKPVDRRADLWSIGVILWEILAEQRLFRRSTQVATLRALLQDEVAPPSTINPRVPEVLDELIMPALDRSVTQRPSTAERFAQDIRRTMEVLQWNPTIFAVGDWVSELVDEELTKSRTQIERCIAAPLSTSASPSTSLVTSTLTPSPSPSPSPASSPGSPQPTPEAAFAAPPPPVAPTETKRSDWIAYASIAILAAVAAGTIAAVRTPAAFPSEKNVEKTDIATIEHTPVAIPVRASRPSVPFPREAAEQVCAEAPESCALAHALADPAQGSEIPHFSDPHRTWLGILAELARCDGECPIPVRSDLLTPSAIHRNAFVAAALQDQLYASYSSGPISNLLAVHIEARESDLGRIQEARAVISRADMSEDRRGWTTALQERLSTLQKDEISSLSQSVAEFTSEEREEFLSGLLYRGQHRHEILGWARPIEGEASAQTLDSLLSMGMPGIESIIALPYRSLRFVRAFRPGLSDMICTGSRVRVSSPRPSEALRVAAQRLRSEQLFCSYRTPDLEREVDEVIGHPQAVSLAILELLPVSTI